MSYEALFAARRFAWDAQRAIQDEERARIAFLSKPIQPNPRELIAPTRCRVLKATFYVFGKRVAEGEIITLPRSDAQSLSATGKVEILK